ncbi:hypothetical protein FRX31_017803 [Thalictrum thalictroides]|uniref:Uncharacterized protein n=1 Tax=Thalictrum thalictroides TaxID=46969 RepID=A0A7J6W7U9_THATH|nr:hypothetical protein FRX31_017803 [Thalictrum thalictroides]
MEVEIPDSHKEAVLGTPFARLFNLFLERRVRKETNKQALFKLIGIHSLKHDAFRLGEGENEKYVRFKPKHVALTFGLPLHGEKVMTLFCKFKFDPDQL